MGFWDSHSIIESIFFDIVGEVDTILDIGACHGVSTKELIRVLKPTLVHAVEPRQANFDVLQKRIDDERVYIHKCAIWYGEEKESALRYSARNMGGTFLKVMEIAKPDHKFTESDEIVPLTTIEELIDFTPDLIKIDVEGAEYNIIRHSTVLKKAKYLFVDWHKPEHEWFVYDNLPMFEITDYFKRDNCTLLTRKNMNDT